MITPHLPSCIFPWFFPHTPLLWHLLCVHLNYWLLQSGQSIRKDRILKVSFWERIAWATMVLNELNSHVMLEKVQCFLRLRWGGMRWSWYSQDDFYVVQSPLIMTCSAVTGLPPAQQDSFHSCLPVTQTQEPVRAPDCWCFAYPYLSPNRKKVELFLCPWTSTYYMCKTLNS